MSHVHDVAIALRHIEYSETSQVLVLFARASGKVRVIAKGIKRGTRTRFATGIDLLELGELVFSHRHDRSAGMDTLVEWRQTTIFPGLRTDLSRLFGGQYAAEVTAQLTEDLDPHPALYDALEQTLGALETAAESLPEVARYQVSLLREVGLFPQLESCTECRKRWRREPGWQFSSHNGGLVCRDCEGVLGEKRRLLGGVIELLGAVQGGKTPMTAPLSDWEGAFDVLDYHLAHLMGRPARLADYVLPQARRRALGRTPGRASPPGPKRPD